jgi:hypothetical protein
VHPHRHLLSNGVADIVEVAGAAAGDLSQKKGISVSSVDNRIEARLDTFAMGKCPEIAMLWHRRGTGLRAGRRDKHLSANQIRPHKQL